MNTVRSNTRIMWTAVGLAAFTALSYILLRLNILGVGDLKIVKRMPTECCS